MTRGVTMMMVSMPMRRWMIAVTSPPLPSFHVSTATAEETILPSLLTSRSLLLMGFQEVFFIGGSA